MASKNLSSLMPELLQKVAFFVATDSLLAAPNIVSLMCTCRAIHAKLAFDAAPYLYDRIFRAKFDVEAPRRRFGEDVLKSANLAKELKKRYVAMDRIRRGDVFSEYVLGDLWLAYLMFLESDGKNEHQLVHRAQVQNFAINFVLNRCMEDSETNNRWPRETDELALAVWILWLNWEPETIFNNEVACKAVLSVLQPFVVAPFKYTTFLVPDTHFAVPFYGNPVSNPPRCTPTVHGQYPIFRRLLYPTLPNVEHFGSLHTIAPPPLATAALLICFSTRQLHKFGPAPNMPLRRADVPPGVYGAVTLEDIHEFNEFALTRLVPRARAEDALQCSFTGEEDDQSPSPTSASSVMMTLLPSSRSSSSSSQASSTRVSSLQHEHDWLRLTHCYNPWLEAKIKIRVYTPGMLNGLWEGRQFIYDASQYAQLLGEADMPANMSDAYPETYLRPCYMRLREHHCIPDGLPVSFGEFMYEEEAMALGEAFFPPDVKVSESDGELSIFDPTTEEHLYYETHVPGKPNSHMRGGGCQECKPDMPIPPAQMREYERLLAQEFESESGKFEDSVNNGCITDIVITGETDFVHSRPWGFFKFIGRVRDLDGLVVLLRVPVEPTARAMGTVIFRGYVHHNQNFVGRWRSTEDTTNFARIEGAFSLCKRAE